jgi:DNA gyrase/topoisomerase IV subunit A
MSRKINALFENKNIQSIDKRNEHLIEKQEEPSKIRELNKKITSLTQDISSKNQRLISIDKSIEGINEDLGFYRRLHQILKENTKIEKQLISKDKIVIEWDIDDWKDILEYREVFKRKR